MPFPDYLKRIAAVLYTEGGTLLAIDANGVVIQGPAADGVAVAGRPVLIAGQDGTPNVQTLLVDSSGRPIVVGAAASGSATAGDPVLVAGTNAGGTVRRLATPSSGEGLSTIGPLAVTPYGWNSGGTAYQASSFVTADADARAISLGVAQAAWQFLYNGSDYDRQRNNFLEVALASAARTATTDSATLTNYNAKGCILVLDVTAVGAPAGQIGAISIVEQTGTEGIIYTFGTLAITTTGTRRFQIHPGAASAASWTSAPLQGALPRSLQVRVTHDTADSITYSVSIIWLN